MVAGTPMYCLPMPRNKPWAVAQRPSEKAVTLRSAEVRSPAPHPHASPLLRRLTTWAATLAASTIPPPIRLATLVEAETDSENGTWNEMFATAAKML
ncbi:hypothetical protein L249_3208 [Ophiocordyceps polyrhachis-furcata BCC 54312]|uniref:Uncharacterized protein n=1 Tax=Ophiocordyceps polyrhachis-furcata BCC 54312 TaxID=1330021 RepID=A0A367LPK7_9HYPO|nr:hypothetical protein L249_3208 [Ophiocordyceps polyrhachis-furcata BCC 54312]